jgi:aryl-alcohol dehydrogenase (NADP+)
MQVEWRPESVEKARIIAAHAEARGSSASHFAVNWVLNNALVTSVIAGPRTLEQWHHYVAALDATFDADDEALANGLVAPGHPSSPGFTDPGYPVLGRVPRTRTA